MEGPAIIAGGLILLVGERYGGRMHVVIGFINPRRDGM